MMRNVFAAHDLRRRKLRNRGKQKNVKKRLWGEIRRDKAAERRERRPSSRKRIQGPQGRAPSARIEPFGYRNWKELVNEPQSEAELEAIRRSVVKGQPYGREAGARQTATQLGLESTLHPRARPKRDEITL